MHSHIRGSYEDHAKAHKIYDSIVYISDLDCLKIEFSINPISTNFKV